ncbi:unnamed protein product [Periconia digitata]|uniref:Uncharacterized protein n=1 Tax=Periconia digitata TaxID=1303443 RepID=A0A9W4UKI2_9PLEO|nr:unnamed protein product [Periconia digitata]
MYIKYVQPSRSPTRLKISITLLYRQNGRLPVKSVGRRQLCTQDASHAISMFMSDGSTCALSLIFFCPVASQPTIARQPLDSTSTLIFHPQTGATMNRPIALIVQDHIRSSPFSSTCRSGLASISVSYPACSSMPIRCTCSIGPQSRTRCTSVHSIAVLNPAPRSPFTLLKPHSMILCQTERNTHFEPRVIPHSFCRHRQYRLNPPQPAFMIRLRT